MEIRIHLFTVKIYKIERCQLRFEMSQKRFQINLARSTLHCCIALYCMFECTTYRMYDMVVQAGG